MFMFLRWLILRTVSCCVGMRGLAPPWFVLAEARKRRAVIVVSYELVPPEDLISQEPCNCPNCRSARGEVNGAHVGRN